MRAPMLLMTGVWPHLRHCLVFHLLSKQEPYRAFAQLLISLALSQRLVLQSLQQRLAEGQDRKTWLAG